MQARTTTMMLAIGLTLTTGCAGMQRHHETAATENAPETAEDCDRLFGERLNAGDVDGLVALYEPNATLMRQDGSAAIGTAAIRTEFAGFVEARPQITMNVVHVSTSGEDVALLHNEWHLTAAGRDGKPVVARGSAVEVVRRQSDGTWRFAIDEPWGGGGGMTPPAHAHHTGTPKKPAKKPAKKHG
jgi:uncharacterized protein (TIGR02246 family)